MDMTQRVRPLVFEYQVENVQNFGSHPSWDPIPCVNVNSPGHKVGPKLLKKISAVSDLRGGFCREHPGRYNDSGI